MMIRKYVYSGIRMMVMIREDDKRIQDYEKEKENDILPQGKTRKLEKL